MKEKFEEFLKEYEDKVSGLYKDACLAYYDASISGKEEDFAKASELQLKLNKLFSNRDDFKKLEEMKGADFGDELLNRQFTRIYNDYLGNQFDEKLLEDIVNLSTKVEQQFSIYRAEIDGKKYTDNELDEILDNSTNSAELEEAWSASKKIGEIVSEDVVKLAHMRNEAAKQLGFSDHHTMSLALSEQNTEDLDKLFDELDELTRDEFARLKNEIDEYLAKRNNVAKEDLMPWHYQDKFFQQGPKIYTVDLDKYYKDQNIEELTKNYFNGIGLPIDDMLEKSSLYEQEGKYQHAYCTDIDKEGDVRVLCNIKPNYRWMGTMLHEFGHAVYDKFVDETLPWSLREHAHIFTTEAIAMLFGRLASNPNWLKKNVGVSEEEKSKIAADCFNSLKLEQLTFSRWVQVMYRFERAFYSNPDQDVNKLWWDLVEKYQMLKSPKGRNAPDWASKIHVALYPAYYHNYMLGELLASQLYFTISEKVLNIEAVTLPDFTNMKQVGEYLLNSVFKPGARYSWNDMIERATGEKLTAKYYAKQFVS